MLFVSNASSAPDLSDFMCFSVIFSVKNTCLFLFDPNWRSKSVFVALVLEKKSERFGRDFFEISLCKTTVFRSSIPLHAMFWATFVFTNLLFFSQPYEDKLQGASVQRAQVGRS